MLFHSRRISLVAVICVNFIAGNPAMAKAYV